MTLLLEDVVECINDKCPAYDVGVNGRTLHSIVQRGIDIACSRTDDGEVNVFQFGMECVDSLRYFVLLGNVCRGGYSRVRMLLPQFVKQMRPSSNDADAVTVSNIFFKESPANA